MSARTPTPASWAASPNHWRPNSLRCLAFGHGERVLDVGCGPGALTRLLVQRLGAAAVSAVDPSESFVTAVRERIPGIDVYRAAAEDLPFADDRFDCAVAQLVVHFMTDPVAGLAEMARVTRPGGLVAACVWDHGTGAGPLSVFWRAVQALDPDARGEATLAGAREGHLAGLFEQAGLQRRGVHGADGPRRLRQLRGLVGAVHPRCGSGRGLRGALGRDAESRAGPNARSCCLRPLLRSPRPRGPRSDERDHGGERGARVSTIGPQSCPGRTESGDSIEALLTQFGPERHHRRHTMISVILGSTRARSAGSDVTM